MSLPSVFIRAVLKKKKVKLYLNFMYLVLGRSEEKPNSTDLCWFRLASKYKCNTVVSFIEMRKVRGRKDGWIQPALSLWAAITEAMRYFFEHQIGILCFQIYYAILLANRCDVLNNCYFLPSFISH